MAICSITAIEKGLGHIIKRLKLPPDMRIRAPENMEGNSIWWYFRSSKIGDVEQTIAFLRADTFRT